GLRPAPERRLRRGPRLGPATHAAFAAPAKATVADRPVAGRLAYQRLATPGPGHLGSPWQAAALRVLQAHVLGRPRPGGEAGRDPRRLQAPVRLAGDRR